jgi:hypothetical protein
MGKEIGYSGYSFEHIRYRVREFWNEQFLQIGAHSLIEIDNPDGDYSYQSLIKRVVAGDTKSPICYYSPTHNVFIKPYLPWDKINRKLKGLRIDDKTKELIIFLLKPVPFEKRLSGFPELKELEKRVCGESNEKLKRLAPLLKQLENIQKDPPFNDFGPLAETIGKIQYEIAFHREIVKRGKGIYRKYYKEMGVDKDLNMSVQKHKFWNWAVSGTLALLNRFYHTGKCEKKCRKMHEEAIRKVAELLKLLYPKIWKEQISTIANRIKQKQYRSIPT